MPECNNSDLKIIDGFQPIPDWMTTEYVENALRSYKRDKSLKIVEIQIKPATGKGENYASVMSRICVKYNSQDQPETQIGSYLIKTSLEGDEFTNVILEPYDIYQREMEIYDLVFPKLMDLLAATGFIESIVPDTIKIDYDRSSIIFEDLAISCYVMPDRKIGLDVIHSKMVLRKLAKMHAASAVLNNITPDIFRSYRGFFNRHTESLRPMYLNNLHACGTLVGKWAGFEKYGEKLLNLESMLMEYGKRSFDVNDVHVPVLTHGDLWTNNVLFKYNANNEPLDVILIDFQYSCLGSPALDLHYFLNTSLSDDLVKDHTEDLVHYYYENFVETLRKLQFKGSIPSLKQFWIEYLEKSFYAFTSSCLIKPIMINENSEDADFESLMKDDEKAKRFKRSIYSNEKVHKILRRVLPVFDRRGLLDIYQ